MSLVIIGAIGGILGCALVGKGRAFDANRLWLITNPFMIYHNILIGDPIQTLLWSIYALLALYGTIHLWNKRR